MQFDTILFSCEHLMKPVTLIFLFFCWTHARCQQNPKIDKLIPKSRHFTVVDGLSNRFIVDISQDRKGFIWLSTYYGLNRFDGYEFKIYTQQSHGLKINSVSGTQEDKEGNIWIFESEGAICRNIDMLDPTTQKVMTFEEKFGKTLPFPVTDIVFNWQRQLDIIKMITTIDGTVWRYEGNGNFRKIFKFSEVDDFISLTETPHETLVAYYKLKNNANELTELNLNGKILRKITEPNISDNVVLSEGKVSGYETANRYVSQKVIQRVPNEHQFIPPTNLKPHEKHLIISYDKSKNLYWVIHSLGMAVFDPITEEIIAIDNLPLAEFKKTVSIYLNKNGTLFIGTSEGLYLFNVSKSQFSSIFKVQDIAKETTISMRGIYVDDKRLWGSTQDNGVVVYDKLTRQKKFILPTLNQRILHAQMPIWKDKRGDVWSSNFTLVKYDSVTLKPEIFQLSGINNTQISVYEDKNGIFLLGKDEGLTSFDPIAKKEIPFRGYNQYKELAKNRVYTIYEDLNRKIWIGTAIGLFILDPKNGITERFYKEALDLKHRLPVNNIWFIRQDKQDKSVYWLTSRGGGLIRWNYETGESRSFGLADGLSHDVIYCAYEDDYDNLWMSSDYGIMKFNKTTFNVQTFLPKDGITHEEFNYPSHFQAPDGTLYFGGLNGVTVFHPKDFVKTDKDNEPPFEITGFQVMDATKGQMIDQTSDFLEKKAIELSPDDKAFAITFSSLNFNLDGHKLYAYRIENWQENWVFQADNDLRINGLPVGKYVLHLKTQLPNGQWAKNELSIPIEVLAPFYLRWWFIAGLIVMGVSGIYWYLKWRTNQLQKENELLEKEVNLRTLQIQSDKKTIEKQAQDLRQLDTLKSNFFVNVSHELRTPLTLILGPLKQLYQRKRNEPDTAQSLKIMERNSEKLLKMVNEILDLSKLEASKLEMHETTVQLHLLTQRLVSTFESQAHHLGIDMRFQNNCPHDLSILLDVQQYETILNNLLANALKFTPVSGTILLEITESNRNIQIKVQDTGYGINPIDLPHIFDKYYQSKSPEAMLQGGTGVGLALSKELANLWKGTLTAESILGEGSTFYFLFPLKESHETVEEIDDETDLSDIIPVNIISNESVNKIAEDEKPSILLVEDNEDMQLFQQSILGTQYNLLIAGNGQKALDILQTNHKISLIISDVMMPVMDGFQLLEKLKNDESLRAIPVLMLTARAALEDKLAALKIGVDDYLTKPFEVEELLARAHNLITNYQQRQKFATLVATGETIKESEEPVEEKPMTIKMSEFDANWLSQFEQVVKKGALIADYSINDMTEAMNISRTVLFVKVKSLTGLSPNQYLQEVRLQIAREYLERGKYKTVKEVAYAVGFQKVSYFAEIFSKRFGVAPNQHAKEHVS